MKHTVLALLLVMAVSLGEAAAQNIALGERVPEIKHTVWLDGHRAEPSAATYIEFYHSANEMSDAALERLCRLCDDAECDLRLIVVTKEPVEKVAPLLRPLGCPCLSFLALRFSSCCLHRAHPFSQFFSPRPPQHAP